MGTVAALRLAVRLAVQSDFHIGTGAGIGRVVDAAFRVDRYGCPVIPGATLKGLAHEEARRLCDAYSALRDSEAESRIFGEAGRTQGSVFFGNATPARGWIPPRVHGRSARDRQSGRALDDHLFRFEDAAAGIFQAEVRCDEPLDGAAIVLLLASLRRIERLGGQRRRGKGQVSVTVEVKNGPENWKGVVLPGNAASFQAALESVLRPRASATIPNPQVEQRVAQTAGCSGVSSVRRNAPETLIVLARADTPLVLTALPEAGNISRSLPYVTGSSLRGALATWLLRAGWWASDDAFAEIFLREGIHFSPLYPSLAWAGQERGLPFPTPRSMLTCKFHPGVWEGGGAHGVVDLLRATDPLLRCGRAACGAPLVPLGGHVQVEIRPGKEERRLRMVEVSTAVHQHVEIDPITQRATEERLFSLEAVAEGTWFAGYLWGNESLLQAVFASLGPQHTAVLQVGKARTRGYGALRVYLQTIKAGDGHSVFPWMLSPEEAGGKEETGADGNGPVLDPGFTIMLYSDLIALDTLLRPVTRLDEGSLWIIVGGLGPPPFRLVRGYAATRRIAGFNGVPGRPRSIDIALVAGSTWAFEWTGTDTERDDGRKKLVGASTRGLGLRRGEGFGRFMIDLPLQACKLDQTRIDAVSVKLDMPGTLEPGKVASTLGEAHPPTPKRSWPTIVPSELPVAEVPDEDRAGLARLLVEAADGANLAEQIEAILLQRKERGKKEKDTDRLLKKLKDCSRDQLRAVARQLSDLDAAKRRGSREGNA